MTINRTSSAFTLIEVIVVLAIIAAMGGWVTLSSTGGSNGDAVIRREADDAAVWLSSLMTRARIEERGFRLTMSECSARNIEIRVVWQDGTFYGKTEKYKSAKARIFPLSGNLAVTHTYSGEWNTLTPALTFDVRPVPPSVGKRLYIVMSGLGNVIVRENVN